MITPGHATEASKVFVVTGIEDPKTMAGPDADIKPVAHYLIANTEHEAVKAVVTRVPTFVPMGVSSLDELKKLVVQMEAVRLGIKPPFNGLYERH